MWQGTEPEKDERSRATVNLRRMEALEKEFRQNREIKQETTEFGGIRIKYVKQSKIKTYDSKLV